MNTDLAAGDIPAEDYLSSLPVLSVQMDIDLTVSDTSAEDCLSSLPELNSQVGIELAASNIPAEDSTRFVSLTDLELQPVDWDLITSIRA